MGTRWNRLVEAGSNEYPQSMFVQKYEKISVFLSENFQFLVVKFSIYLNRRVFVMCTLKWVISSYMMQGDMPNALN